MNWLIVEDALRDQRGHWFEYIGALSRGLHAAGHRVTILSDRDAQPFIRESLGARPVLPPSIWHRMSEPANRFVRLARIPRHAWATQRAVSRFLRIEGNDFDVAFIPTVLVHHMLGWHRLLRSGDLPSRMRLLFFFPNLPITPDGKGDGSPSFRLLRWLLRSLHREIGSGQVILGVETEAMLTAAEAAFGMKFVYFPHPVEAESAKPRPPGTHPHQCVLACYGPARHEKGSDLLVEAIRRYRAEHDTDRVRFVIQWIDDFVRPDGSKATIPESLRSDPGVEIVSRYFREGEYVRRLEESDALILPYRTSAYALRVSRVVIEAMVHGIPVIATKGTTLQAQAEHFGTCVACDDGDAASVAAAIARLVATHESLAELATARAPIARRHFSVETFLECLPVRQD
ncbi:MAG TPA: glycosyltransferase [Opitutaceae bacterium]